MTDIISSESSRLNAIKNYELRSKSNLDLLKKQLLKKLNINHEQKYDDQKSIQKYIQNYNQINTNSLLNTSNKINNNNDIKNFVPSQNTII